MAQSSKCVQRGGASFHLSRFRVARRSGNGRIRSVMDAAHNISLPEPLAAEIESAAEAEHRSLDEVLTDAVKRYGAEPVKPLGIKESDVDR